MQDAQQDRRLTAILAADVVGYSARMNRDESGTLAALQAMRRDVIEPRIARYGGRTIKLMGDGHLVEFPSVVDAVRCAVDVQHALAHAQEHLPDDDRIEQRIGINVGDVIVDGDDIYGDGVNIAARLEAIAPPGGICLSRMVMDHVAGKLDLDITPLGPQSLKNIAAPVEAFRVEVNDRSERLSQPLEPKVATPVDTARTPHRRRLVTGLVVMAALALAAALFWQMRTGPAKKPVIAVLPFQDVSAEAQQGLLGFPVSDGILAHLARYPELTVIARGSSFRFRDGDRDLREIGAQLGADYILEGSLQFDGARLTVNAGLVDVATNLQTWSDTITRDIDDMFEVTSEIGRRVAFNVEDHLRDVRVDSAGAINSDALLRTMQARRATMRGLSEENNAALIELNRETVALYPEEPWGHLALAFALRTHLRFGWADDPDAMLQNAIFHGEEAVRLDPENYSAHFALGRVRLQQGDHKRAIEALETALALNPSSANAMNALAQSYFYQGDNETALEVLARSEAIAPLPHFVHSWVTAWVLWQGDQCEEAEAAFRKISSPPPEAQKLASVIQTCLGNPEAAKAALAKFLERSPDWTVAREAEVQDGVWSYEPGLERWLENLSAAGLPD